jgi:hypothetical protein
VPFGSEHIRFTVAVRNNNKEAVSILSFTSALQSQEISGKRINNIVTENENIKLLWILENSNIGSHIEL